MPPTSTISRRGAARLLLAGLLVAAPAIPGGAAERRTLRYRIEMGGVEVGEMEVAAEAGEDAAEASLAWKMGGPFGLGGRSKGSLESRSRLGRSEILPGSFESRSESSDRERAVSIRYGEDGGIEQLRLTRNGKSRKSEVPDELQAGTVDTLTAFWRLRRWAGAGGEGPLQVPVFDGRRRYDLVARRTGEARVELRLVLKAGFDDDGEVFGSPVDPERPWAEVLLTPGPDPIPLSAAGTGRPGWRITLRQ